MGPFWGEDRVDWCVHNTIFWAIGSSFCSQEKVKMDGKEL